MNERPRLEAELKRYIEAQLDARIFTHAYIEAGFLGKTEPTLKLSYLPDQRSIFDLASITKAVTTTSVFFGLLSENKVALDGSLRDWCPRTVRLKDTLLDLSAREILAHKSGLPAWRNFWTNRLSTNTIPAHLFMDAPAHIEAVFARDGMQLGDKVDRYSDVGFILLGYILEKLTQRNMSQLFRDFCANQRLLSENASLFFMPNEAERQGCISTGMCHVRNRELVGEVHDENCAALGGVSGHSGIFGSGESLGQFLREFFKTNVGRLTFEENVRAMTKKADSALCGYRFGNDPVTTSFCQGQVFGHYGFTGTAFWIEPKSEKYVIFLTNRVVSGRVNPEFRLVRQKVFSLVDQILKKHAIV